MTTSVIPCMRYRNAPAAIDWLCRAFGFETQLVVPNPDGTIAHAQLRFGNGMIMLGSVVDSEFGRLMKQPAEVGGAETQTAYVIVQDADAHHARANSRNKEEIWSLIKFMTQKDTQLRFGLRSAGFGAEPTRSDVLSDAKLQAERPTLTAMAASKNSSTSRASTRSGRRWSG